MCTCPPHPPITTCFDANQCVASRVLAGGAARAGLNPLISIKNNVLHRIGA